MRLPDHAALLALAATFALGGCGSGDAPGRTSASAGRLSVGGGVTTLRPPGWTLTAPRISALAYPAERLLLTSYPTKPGGNCGPDRAETDLPPGGALIYLFELRPQVGSAWAGLRRADFPRRPAHFALRRRDLGRYECWRVPSYAIRFRAADRPFQVHVAFGAHASAARRAQVLRVLDGLRFTTLPAPPPDPYAGWHALHDETGDTLRTPPGWLAAGVPSPRRRAQPRTLFLTANRALKGLPARPSATLRALPRTFPRRTLAAFPSDGVLLWVREDSPGPASAHWPALAARAWPRAGDFATLTTGSAARWPQLRWSRASAQQRETRYSLWIVSGPRASAADLARARLAAASFAFSVGSFRNRACRRTCESGRPVKVVPADGDAGGGAAAR